MARGVRDESSSGWGRVLVIMPTFNEIDSLAKVAGHLLDTVPGVHLLIVDDRSPDGTGDLADALAADHPRVSVLHRADREGLGRAYLAGFEWAANAGYDVVVEMDADGSHPAETLPQMLDALTGVPKPGLVIGSRWIAGGAVVNWPRSRLLLSRAANTYARLALRMPTHDITAGYRAYPIEIVKAIAAEHPLARILVPDRDGRSRVRRRLLDRRGAHRVPRARSGPVQDELLDRRGGDAGCHSVGSAATPRRRAR